ncbi:hypothetical protein RhiirA4_412554 [Rhizophagus irregularis]|uniref:Uncharacterized protein n=1 Tax=Rhizophagus irregularis TaxID=588596 RepID=A0A2I1HLU0_9GLOM|nr:hypothetical protein RhiirA4_405008 [Rhizophagus irregularis]PKY59845.1 hypothetical protein RhiirA4_412554 [Rhizophagus irregularis]
MLIDFAIKPSSMNNTARKFLCNLAYAFSQIFLIRHLLSGIVFYYIRPVFKNHEPDMSKYKYFI